MLDRNLRHLALVRGALRPSAPRADLGSWRQLSPARPGRRPVFCSPPRPCCPPASVATAVNQHYSYWPNQRRPDSARRPTTSNNFPAWPAAVRGGGLVNVLAKNPRGLVVPPQRGRTAASGFRFVSAPTAALFSFPAAVLRDPPARRVRFVLPVFHGRPGVRSTGSAAGRPPAPPPAGRA